MRRDDDKVIIPLQGPTLDDTEHAAAVQSSIRSVEVRDDDDYHNVSEMLGEVAAEHKRLKAEMEQTIKPINEGIKRVRDLYKPALDSLQCAQQAMRQAMLTYRAEQNKRKADADAKAREALAAGRHQEALQQVEQAVAQDVRAAGTQIRKIWRAEVFNIDQVPREFLQVDTAALRRDAVARGWQNPPAGVKYVQVESLAVVK